MTKQACVFLVLCFSVGLLLAQPETPPAPAENEGVLQLPEGISLDVTAPDGTKTSIEPTGGRAILPVGKYIIRDWIYQKTDAEGNLWKLQCYAGPIRNFEIGAEPVSLAIKPEPIDVSLNVRCQDEYIFTLSLTGPAGERLYLHGGKTPDQPPPIVITNQDKSFSVILTGKYG